ncbi:hypothetical protein K443DRAFT_682732 [Laccaria amethystina LaAM-08-1]|uniref:Autophagy-related protein n=1 Tax=Laccaria amethystina LaAM-08-1 TaxID=1095629 RepID=A0A0C9XI67_9AGAR|nr:hypothetical protein K443DRAFT_682732 [Laccaria amethystina LaAM-08-1]
MKSPHKFVAFLAGVTLAFPTTAVAGTNFDDCLTKVRNGTFGVGVDVGGTDDRGYPVANVSLATGITYSRCIQVCGGGQEPFQWSVFSQQFSSWLLPWLALVSQLPFGANDKLDNLDSVLLTVGSPTLAAYSLTLTVLNSRWVTRRLAPYTYPNVRNAIHILSSLQQSPIRVLKEGGLLASLIVLPQNDDWWTELTEWIDFTHTWSISAATSIAWVVIAYVFTVIDSFTLGITNSINSNGQGVGSLWLWLLPIVIGWLQISPKCDSARLSSAVERANKLAHVATDDGHVVPVKEAQTEARAIELTLTEVDDLRRDEKCTAPIFNYARFLPWVQAVEDVSEAFQAASDHFHNHDSVDPSIDWVTVERGQKPNERNRVGTRTQVENYCTPWQPAERPRSRWGPKVVSRMFLASALALMLQWGTAGAALIQVWYTPTRGLGCRSASYLLYAVLSTIVWMLLVTSSILTHYASTTQYHFEGRAIRHWPARAARRASIIFRCLGKLTAAFNSLWVVVSCLFQFGSFFDNCYCNSSVFWLRDHAYNVIALQPGDVTSITSAWIGGVCLAGGTAIICVGFINVFIDPPLPD